MLQVCGLLACLLAVSLVSSLTPRQAAAQNPPSNYTPQTTPYSGTESWYCERITGTVNGRCSFADLTSSISTLANLTSASALTTTGTITAGGAASAGFNLNLGTIAYTGTLPNAQLSFSLPLSVANGGTGTASPGTVAGNGISVTGSFPTQTVAQATGGTYQLVNKNPAATTSATYVMMGVAGTTKITPTRTGIIMVTGYGDILDSGVSDNCVVNMSFGTGTSPTNGSANTGTNIGTDLVVNSAAGVGSVGVGFSNTGVVTGLTINTAYWIDFKIKTQTASGATCTLQTAGLSAMEQ